MSYSLDDRLRSLMRLSKTELSNLWQQLFENDPPPNIRKDLMQRLLGYRIQEREFGSLSHESRTRLHQVARELESNLKAVVSPTVRIKPGTRLARQWKEQVHVVTVEDSGYEYRGVRYESLSEIARRITGTKWSGPLFFGLKRQPAESQEAQ